MCDWLNEFFEERWIGRSGTIPWPAQSPDLTLYDLSLWLWGDLKRLMYAIKSRNLDYLKAKIVEAALGITADTQQKALMAFKRRLSDFMDKNGAHIEQ